MARSVKGALAKRGELPRRNALAACLVGHLYGPGTMLDLSSERTDLVPI